MSEARRAGEIVAARIHSILDKPGELSPYARQALASLRRGAGKEPGSVPDIWQFTHAERRDGRPDERLETAVHVTLTQWAMHQQSKSGHMHRPDRSFGAALRLLANSQDRQSPEKTPAYRRMMALASARTLAGVTTHARGLIGLLRANDIAFDYAGWANDLYWIQVPGHAADVQRRWGRDFYRLQDLHEGDEEAADTDNPTQN